MDITFSRREFGSLACGTLVALIADAGLIADHAYAQDASKPKEDAPKPKEDAFKPKEPSLEDIAKRDAFLSEIKGTRIELFIPLFKKIYENTRVYDFFSTVKDSEGKVKGVAKQLTSPEATVKMLYGLSRTYKKLEDKREKKLVAKMLKDLGASQDGGYSGTVNYFIEKQGTPPPHLCGTYEIVHMERFRRKEETGTELTLRDGCYTKVRVKYTDPVMGERIMIHTMQLIVEKWVLLTEPGTDKQQKVDVTIKGYKIAVLAETKE